MLILCSLTTSVPYTSPRHLHSSTATTPRITARSAGVERLQFVRRKPTIRAYDHSPQMAAYTRWVLPACDALDIRIRTRANRTPALSSGARLSKEIRPPTSAAALAEMLMAELIWVVRVDQHQTSRAHSMERQ